MTYFHDTGVASESANDPAAVVVSAVAPRIRVPIMGSGNMQVELTGVGYDLFPRVVGDIRRSRGQVSDLFLMEGQLHIEQTAHALWLHVGTAAFRTDSLHLPSLQDFMEDVKEYARDRKAEAANADTR